MREDNPSQIGTARWLRRSKTANSLFRNILPANPFQLNILRADSRIYPR
jgi:hypothetical protein